jgi:hypothetical protein
LHAYWTQSYRPLRDGPPSWPSQAISCLATIIQSLDNKPPLPVHILTPHRSARPYSRTRTSTSTNAERQTPSAFRGERHDRGHVAPLKDSSALFEKWSDSLAMTERVEMCRRTVVVDGKVYSVRRQSDSVFLLRLNEIAVRYVVVTADSIDFHGFERFVWPEAAGQISSFEKLDDAAAYYQKLTGTSSKD